MSWGLDLPFFSGIKTLGRLSGDERCRLFAIVADPVGRLFLPLKTALSIAEPAPTKMCFRFQRRTEN